MATEPHEIAIKDLLDELTVEIIKKKFNLEPPYTPDQIIKLESYKVSLYFHNQPTN
jgi:hypothetical protein